MDRKEAFSIAEEILNILAIPNSHFQENMRDYICNKLDIKDEVLVEALEIISKENIKEKKKNNMIEKEIEKEKDILSIYLHIKGKEELPLFGFSNYEIDEICRIIESTIINKKPIDILEEMIRDADLEYIGRDYYFYIIELLRRERSILHSVWIKEQLAFMKRHKFITRSAKKLFDHQKEINYRKLVEKI